MANHDGLVRLSTADWVESVDEVWIIEVNLVGVDAHSGAILRMHLLHAFEVLAAKDDLVIPFIQPCCRCIASDQPTQPKGRIHKLTGKFWPWDVGQGMKRDYIENRYVNSLSRNNS